MTRARKRVGPVLVVVKLNYVFTGAQVFVCVPHVSENLLLGGLLLEL